MAANPDYMDDAPEPLDEQSAILGFLMCKGLPDAMNPQLIGERLLELPEFEHLIGGSAVISWMFRTAEKRRQGRRILGTCYMPTVQGDLKDLFSYMLTRLLGMIPDFLITLDWQFWYDATPQQREILCYHEMLHAGQAKDAFGAPRFDREGNPVWAIRGHDIEEFDEVVRRYGMHSEDLARFMQAYTDHLEFQ